MPDRLRSCGAMFHGGLGAARRLRSPGVRQVETKGARTEEVEEVWASPSCLWSPIGDLSVTASQKVSQQSVTKKTYPFNLAMFCRAETIKFYGSEREKAGGNSFPRNLQNSCFVITLLCEDIYGNL